MLSEPSPGTQGLRVLHLRSAFEDSGPGTQSLTIGEELRRRGYEVEYAASGGLLAPKIQRSGFRFTTIPTLGLNRRDPVGVAQTVWRVAALLKQHQVDIVHAHNAAAAYCAYFATKLVPRAVGLVHSVRGIELRPRYGWRNWIYKVYPATMLAVSEYTKRELIRIGADAERIVLTYNGVDLERFDPGKLNGEAIRREFELGERTVIGHVGAFSGNKGQQVLVRALAHCRAAHPDVAVLFVGDGPARAQAEREVDELGLREAVRFAGFRTDVEHFHAAFDVYTQPSTFGEMFPNSILESMAMGNPWVGSDISGLSELTAAGKAGVVTAPGDDVALAGALKPLLGDPELRRRMGSAARQEVEQRFTIAAVVDRIEAAYGRVRGAAGRP